MLAYALITSPTYLDYPELYRQQQLDLQRFTNTRALNKAIAKHPPDLLIAEFFYGYGNNYAGINLSNLDVSLHSLRRYAPDAKVIVLADKTELEYVDKLGELFTIHAALSHPVQQTTLGNCIQNI